MYIIDKKRDFYDHYSYIYGVDKSIVYDRRNSIVISDDVISFISGKEFNKKITQSIHIGKYAWRIESYFVILEIGNIQHLIELSDFVAKQHPESGTKFFETCKMKVVRTFRDNIHRFTTPISLHGVQIPFDLRWNIKKVNFSGRYEEIILRVLKTYTVENPLLAETQLTSLLDGKEVWKELQTYISSLDNDIDFAIPMTDIDKAEIHGFDKKTSFRHPVKITKE